MEYAILDRESLHREVWAEPLRKVAERYRVRVEKLRKICRELAIPLPTQRSWHAIAAGKGEAVRPLRPTTGRTSYAITPTRPEDDIRQTPEDDAWFEERCAFERQAGNAVRFEAKPARWHPAVEPHWKRLTLAAKELVASREAYAVFERAPAWRQQKMDSERFYRWRWVKERGQRIDDSRERVPIRASIETYERALTIMNALASSARSRGFVFSDDPEEGRFVMTGHGAALKLRITEQLLEQTREREGYKGRKEIEKYQVPTGRLRISISRNWGDAACLEDEPDRPLELRFGEIYERLYRLVLLCRIDGYRKKALGMREAQAARLRQIEEERKLLLERRKAARKRRIRVLKKEAVAWIEAKRLRAFARQVVAESRSKGPDVWEGSPEASWFEWAMGVAARMDPVTRRRERIRRRSGRSGVAEGDPCPQ